MLNIRIKEAEVKISSHADLAERALDMLMPQKPWVTLQDGSATIFSRGMRGAKSKRTC